MEERRRSVRQKCRLRGRIYFYDGRKSVPCGIRDISYEGARIELLEPIDIPDAREAGLSWPLPPDYASDAALERVLFRRMGEERGHDVPNTGFLNNV
jgi:hypothetical protein